MTTLTGTGTTTTLSSLTNGTAYQVRVAATNRSGDSSWSTSATATPADEPAKPSAPTVTVWNKSLRVSWTAPADNGASITDYDVRHRACTANPATCASNPTWGQWTTLSGNADPGTTTTATIAGLTNGTAYQVQVQATNSVGDSGWSDSTNGTPAVQKPAAPSAPTLTVDNARLGVEWSAPADNGSAITDYNVQYRKQNTDNSWPGTWSSHAHTGTATTASITGLTNDSAYQVQVQAVNGVGDGGWSASSEATPTAQKPDAPTAPTLTYSDQSLGVEWSAPANNGASITDYDVRYCTDSTGCANDTDWTPLNDTGNNSTSTATTASITGLTNGTDYQVQVRAGNSVGDGAWSASTKEKPSTVPSAPAAPTLTVNDVSLGGGMVGPVGRRRLVGHRLQGAALRQQHRLQRRQRMDDHNPDQHRHLDHHF